MTARLMVMIANKASRDTARRVSRQKLDRASKGIPHKGRHRLFGYDGDWNVIPSEAAVIQEAFTRRSNGESTTAIAKDFTRRGIKTVSGRDWSSGVLGETLTKYVYAGKVTYKGEVVADSIYAAIVDEATFNAAQANLANDRKGTNARKYLLSGILVCRLCLTPMKGQPHNQMYRCSTTYGGCGRLSVRIEQADKWIPVAALNKAIEEQHKVPTQPPRDFASEVAGLEGQRTRVQQGYEAGIYDLKEAQTQMRDLRAQIAALNKQAARTKTKTGWVTRTFLDYYGMNLSAKRAFIGAFIENVVVGPAVSRGNQPFNPARFEVHYTDGQVATLDGAIDPEDV